jgi:hypothetical protein
MLTSAFVALTASIAARALERYPGVARDPAAAAAPAARAAAMLVAFGVALPIFRGTSRRTPTRRSRARSSSWRRWPALHDARGMAWRGGAGRHVARAAAVDRPRTADRHRRQRITVYAIDEPFPIVAVVGIRGRRFSSPSASCASARLMRCAPWSGTSARTSASATT